MKRTLWAGLLAAALGSAAYAGAEPSQDQQTAPPVKQQTKPTKEQTKEQAKQGAIDQILNQPLPDSAYTEKERCLADRQYDVVDVVDDRHLLFKGRHDNLWLNELRYRCLGLRPKDVLQFEIRSNRVCDLDTFRAIDPYPGAMPGGICSLGQFTPVTPEQVEAIKAAVQESRKR